MNFIRKIEGAVFYVDILGFAALTQNEIQLEKEHYSCWLDKYHQTNYDNHLLAAAVLSEFRDILNKVKSKYNSITISQLSDCAFIWSENTKELILAANNIMSECITNGIMCRGGISHGEIIETTKQSDLGRFILGKAVTEAVKLEGLAKGCRIMISTKIPNALLDSDKNFSNKIYTLFQPFTNPLDYLEYDEFKWYVIPFMDDNCPDLNFINKKTKLDLIESRLILAGIIRSSPKYYWNSVTSQGQLQLRASVNFIAQSNDLPLEFEHDYNWNDIIKTRSDESVKNLKARLSKEKNSPKPFIQIE